MQWRGWAYTGHRRRIRVCYHGVGEVDDDVVGVAGVVELVDQVVAGGEEQLAADAVAADVDRAVAVDVGLGDLLDAHHVRDAAGEHDHRGDDAEDLDGALREAQQRVIDMVGDEVGTPVISFGEGAAYFGPVLSPSPKGEEAGVLFDGLAAMSSVSGFFELKRSRTTGPIFD